MNHQYIYRSNILQKYEIKNLPLCMKNLPLCMKNLPLCMKVKLNFFSSHRSEGKPEMVKPEMVYTNTDTQKLDILKDNKGKSGIYC